MPWVIFCFVLMTQLVFGEPALPKSSDNSAGNFSDPTQTKSTQFGFVNRLEGEIEGTVYDLKFGADGTTPTGISSETFQEVVKKMIANCLRPTLFTNYHRLDERLVASSFYAPAKQIPEDLEACFQKWSIKPEFLLIHYSGSFASPLDGEYRFVGAGDDSLLVLVDGQLQLEGNRNADKRFSESNFLEGADVRGFFSPKASGGDPKTKLRIGKWMALRSKQPHQLDILLVHQGEPGDRGFDSIAYALLIEKQGVKYRTQRVGGQASPVLPPFLLSDPDSRALKVFRENKNKLEVDLKTTPFCAP